MSAVMLDQRVQLLEHASETAREELGEMRKDMHRVREGIKKLVVLSERQTTQREALERAFTALRTQGEELKSLRLEMTTLQAQQLPQRLGTTETQIRDLQSTAANAKAIGGGVAQIAIRWISAAGIAIAAVLITLYATRGH